MIEKRELVREILADHDVRVHARLPDGTTLERDVIDVSEGGARITGPTRGLKIGDKLWIVLHFPTTEKVGYDCIVRHIEPDGSAYGVEITSEPVPIETVELGILATDDA